jgi:hypothetical protein
VLRLYWALTLIVSGVVLLRTDWPASMPPAVAAGMALTAAAVVVPILLFARLCGGLLALMRRMLA